MLEKIVPASVRVSYERFAVELRLFYSRSRRGQRFGDLNFQLRYDINAEN